MPSSNVFEAPFTERLQVSGFQAGIPGLTGRMVLLEVQKEPLARSTEPDTEGLVPAPQVGAHTHVWELLLQAVLLSC